MTSAFWLDVIAALLVVVNTVMFIANLVTFRRLRRFRRRAGMDLQAVVIRIRQFAGILLDGYPYRPRETAQQLRELADTIDHVIAVAHGRRS